MTTLKSIEAELGRDLIGGVFKGPRTIDIDILTYGDLEMRSELLNIPHACIRLRDFVSAPMRDLLPQFQDDPESPNYVTSNPVPIIPTRRAVLRLDSPPILMGVLNVTPDSFQATGRFPDPAQAIAHALGLLDAGAKIIDVGGESTRPGASVVSLEEQLARVQPVIEGVRRHAPKAIIAMDTS